MNLWIIDRERRPGSDGDGQGIHHRQHCSVTNFKQGTNVTDRRGKRWTEGGVQQPPPPRARGTEGGVEPPPLPPRARGTEGSEAGGLRWEERD